jgi:hypothetical protein
MQTMCEPSLPGAGGVVVRSLLHLPCTRGIFGSSELSKLAILSARNGNPFLNQLTVWPASNTRKSPDLFTQVKIDRLLHEMCMHLCMRGKAALIILPVSVLKPFLPYTGVCFWRIWSFQFHDLMPSVQDCMRLEINRLLTIGWRHSHIATCCKVHTRCHSRPCMSWCSMS